MSDQQPSRRRFLGAAAVSSALALTGCLGSFDGGNGESGSALALSLSRSGDSLRESFVVDLARTTPDWDDAAFEATLDGDDYTTQYRKPFASAPADPVYTERDGTYYRLGSVVVDEVEATHPVLRLSEADNADDVDDAQAVAADSLPEGDATAIRIAQMATRARGNPGGAPWGLVQRGGFVYRNASQVRASDLVADDGPAFVRYRDRRYAVEVSRETFYEPIYRATIEPVADDPERMEAILRATFVDARFERADLSAAAREVVETAREGSYEESHPFSDAYREVLRAMHKRAYLDGDISKDAGVDDAGRRFLRYDGVYYDYRLGFVRRGD